MLRQASIPPTTTRLASSGDAQIVLSYQPWMPRYWDPVCRRVHVPPAFVERQTSPPLRLIETHMFPFAPKPTSHRPAIGSLPDPPVLSLVQVPGLPRLSERHTLLPVPASTRSGFCGSTLTSRNPPVSRRVQLSPPSVDLHRPVSAAAKRKFDIVG